MSASEDQYPPESTFEMDTLSTSQARSRSRLGGKESVVQGSISTKDYAIGVVMLLVVICMWTSSSFIAQDMFEGGYNKPFLLTYVNTSSFALYLIPFFLRRIWDQYRRSRESNTERGEYQPLMNDPVMVNDSQVFCSNEPPPLTVRETAKLSLIFCYIWFIANWSVNASLDYTSVSSATILSSMSGFFTLGVGRLFRVEMLSMGKIGAVIASFLGVVLISLSDSEEPASLLAPLAENIPIHTSRRLLGDSLALISSMFYAIYVILLKVRMGDESRVNMTLFFGFVGLFNILSCWPVGIFLHLVGLEKFELPSTEKQMVALAINTFITLTSDYLYVMAMLRTTPLVATVGISLTIPLAVLGDYFLGKPSGGQVILGALLVLFSFIAIGMENSKRQETDGRDIADEG